MKTRNYTKEYLSNRISKTSKDINQCKYRIQMCETIIKKSKNLLNDSKLPHDVLWECRDELKSTIKMLRELKKEFNMLNSLYGEKFNYQPRKSFVCCYF